MIKDLLLHFELASTVVLIALACGDNDEGRDATPFRVGVMESLTGLGETYGSVANRAKQMAADEINAAGGINGRRLELVVEDSKCSGMDAIAAYEKLTEVDGITLPWHLGSAYDNVYITAECLRQTNDDQDAEGFRDYLYAITWSGAIGDGYSFDANGEVVGLSRVVVEVLPAAERTADRKYRVLGPAPDL